VPSKKQRRRREKLKRHEYEYVVETEDGEEIAVERPRDAERADVARGAKNGRRGEPALVDRRGRPVQKPTLTRVFRRAAFFAPVLFVFVYWTGRDRLSTIEMAVNTLVLVAFFIPFSYLVDTMVYRLVLRRHQRDAGRTRGR
jgi:hypothetical protein